MHPSNRRNFIKQSALAGASAIMTKVLENHVSFKNQEGLIDWKKVRADFPIANWEKLHLNSGSAGVMPLSTTEHLIELIRYVNSKAPYQVWSEWQEIKKTNLIRLAELVGAQPQELEVVRNTTEALNMIITGLTLDRGDEVVLTSNAYGFAVNSWRRKARLEGGSIKEVTIKLPLADDEVIASIENAMSDRTRYLHLTHITHREGHIMPIKRLTEIAGRRGIQVVVDGAHVVGHIGVNLTDLECDYYASSLHKWLNAPLGTGLIYVSEKRIGQIEGHLSSYDNAADSMDKYEQRGTRSWANEIGISAALDYHDALGGAQKEERLKYLKSYWMDQLAANERVYFSTSKEQSAAVISFGLHGSGGSKIVKALHQDFDIHAKSVGGPWGGGVRVSPNIFTIESDLDRLVKAVQQISKA